MMNESAHPLNNSIHAKNINLLGFEKLPFPVILVSPFNIECLNKPHNKSYLEESANQGIRDEFLGTDRHDWGIHERFYGHFIFSKSIDDSTIVSALSSVGACRPDIIQRCFIQPENNQKDPASHEFRAAAVHPQVDTFTVRLWLKGEWSSLELDMALPCRANGELLTSYSSETSRDNWWAPFLVKAFAAASGGFHSINRITLETALR
jgi:hypothetical protein